MRIQYVYVVFSACSSSGQLLRSINYKWVVRYFLKLTRYFCTDWAAGLIFMLVSPQGGSGCHHNPCLRAPPHCGPVSGGHTCRLMGCVKHSDILQTPVSERRHNLAVIVMGGSGRLNQQAGDLYYAVEYVRWKHTHIYSSTPSVSAVRGAAAHTPGWMVGRSFTVLLGINSFSTSPKSHHVFLCVSPSWPTHIVKFSLYEHYMSIPSPSLSPNSVQFNSLADKLITFFSRVTFNINILILNQT